MLIGPTGVKWPTLNNQDRSRPENTDMAMEDPQKEWHLQSL